MTKGEIEALIVSAEHWATFIDRHRPKPGSDASDVAGLLLRLADALALTRVQNSNDAYGDLATTVSAVDGTQQSIAPAGSALERGLAYCGIGVPYGDHSVGESAAQAAYAVLRCCDLIRAGDWRVPSRIGSVTQEMVQSRIIRSSAKQNEGDRSRDELNTSSQPVKILPDTEHDGGEVFDRWLPIETAPKDGEPLLLANFAAMDLLVQVPHVWSGRWFIDEWEGYSYAATNENGQPTHWSPLLSIDAETIRHALGPFASPPPRTGGEG